MKTRSFGNAMLYTFQNQNGMVMEVTDFGATLYALQVPDRDGNLVDVVLGYDCPKGYLRPSGTNFGGTIGRNGNRIGNASFVLNGKEYRLAKNNNGNNLHSGYDQYNLRMWEVKKTTDNSITFSLQSPNGDQGYPGSVDVDVTYTLTEENEVRIDYFAVPGDDTILNLTNHSYFNLDGHASGDVLQHELWVDADAFTPTDAELIPTGEICPVENTPMDFRIKKTVGRDIDAPYEALIIGGGYDHNWCLNNQGKLEKVAELSSTISGIVMETYTDLPGVQIYTGNFLDEEPGKQGVVYRRRQGICLETQKYPDGIHHSNFPDVVCRKGETYRTTTEYKFRIDG